MTGSAFNCAAGALMLERQMLFPNPVPDNPHDLNLLGRSGPDRIDLIRSIGYNCLGDRAVISLKK